MRGLAGLALAVLLAACGPGLPKGVSEAVLDDAVGTRLGDPGLCVLVADSQGKVIYRYGGHVICARQIPACTNGQPRSGDDALKAALAGETLVTSCPSTADGARGAGWALGRTPVRGLPYAAAMESERALPGMEIERRVQAAFTDGGL